MSVKDDVRQLVSGPCDAPAGSRRKQQFLALRTRFGLPLWHPGDSREIAFLDPRLSKLRGPRGCRDAWRKSQRYGRVIAARFTRDSISRLARSIFRDTQDVGNG